MWTCFTEESLCQFLQFQYHEENSTEQDVYLSTLMLYDISKATEIEITTEEEPKEVFDR